jgi:uncharacterized protein (TIGR00159 family)
MSANILMTPHQIALTFLSISMKDIFDIVIVAICIYLVLLFIKQTRSNFILIAIVILFGINFISQEFDLGLTRRIFEPLLTFFIAIFIIVFQPEIRKFFKWISAGRKTTFAKALSLHEENAETIVRSVFEMAKKRVGAIIVLPGQYPLDDLIEGGFPLDGKISMPLILSIFDSSSPGHDGAVLIEGSRIKMFGLHLPLAREFSEYNRVGTRHRATAGITEKTDALAIAVSEERGEVSISQNGKLTKVNTPEELATIIQKFTDTEGDASESTKGLTHYLLVKNSYAKITAILLSIVFWFFLVHTVGIVKNTYSVPVEFKYLKADQAISANSPSTVKVTITGSNKDIAGLKTEDIHAVIDASEFKVGQNNINIDKSNIKLPAYIELDSFTPKNLQIITKPVTN